MVLIPKEASPLSLDETRPIALMEVALKLLTNIIANRTLRAWVKHKSLEDSQYAFLPGISTADPLQVARCVYELSNKRVKQLIPDSSHIPFNTLEERQRYLRHYCEDEPLQFHRYYCSIYNTVYSKREFKTTTTTTTTSFPLRK